MAIFSFRNERLPVGATVEAFSAVGFTSRGERPPGQPVATTTVSTGGTVVFDIDPGKYIAYSNVNGTNVLVRFQVDEDPISLAGTPGPQGPPGPPGSATNLPRPIVVPFCLPNDLTVGTGSVPFVVPEPGGTIQEFRSRAGSGATDAPDGQAVIFDVNKNGTTLFTNQANRPRIARKWRDGGISIPAVTQLLPGDVITVDRDQVGGAVAEGATFVTDNSDASAFSTSTYNVTRPPGIDPNDLHIAIIRVRDTTTTWSAPANRGWNFHASPTVFGSAAKLWIFWRFDDGTTDAHQFTANGVSSSIFAYSIVYRGAALAGPIGANATSNPAFSATHTAPALTTTVDNATVVLVDILDSSKTTAAPPAGHTGRRGFDGTNTALRLADIVQPTAGSVASASYTLSGAALGGIARISLKPDPIPGSPSPGRNATVVMRYIETPEGA